MKTLKLAFTASSLLFCLASFAQETQYYIEIQNEIQTGKELVEQNKFSSAYRQFEEIQQKVEPESEIFSEAEYFKSFCALKSGSSAGNKMVENFIDNYPDSPYINYAWYNLADFQFEKKQYAATLRSYAKIDLVELEDNDRIKSHYQMGYSHMMQENLDKALSEFSQVKDRNSLYSKPATYYWAHLNYLKGNYDLALQGFSRLNNDPVYSRVIPLYVSHIYYKQEMYSEVVDYIVPIIDQVEEAHKPELNKIVGDSYFHLKEFKKAIPYLEFYDRTPGPKTREENYILGFCYYNSGKFQDAIPYLEKASKGKDETAQSSCYHLADCYVKTNQKERAQTAFGAAADMDFDEQIKEDALFNYAKLTYELSYSPFNETIKAFDKYITLYPNSERNTDAYQYLVDVYMVTKNYKDAISSIEKIKNRTPSINLAWQRVTFYRGIELFSNQDYNGAIDYFDKSIAVGQESREIYARALYWKGEALYRTGDYNSAIGTLRQFSHTASAFSLPEYNEGNYSTGYAYFKLEDFRNSQEAFRKYLSAMGSKRDAKVADALNRMGDIYYLNRDYNEAVANYQRSYTMRLYDADYALYQIAFCQGLQQGQKQKINNLQKLITDFPESAYTDIAFFELGKAYESEGNNYEASNQYMKIIGRKNQSPYTRRALLQLGLINYNSTDYQKAIGYYKQVVENYPGTPEAQSALLGIKNCYVELNDVESYFAYAAKTGSATAITVSEQDSLTYISAERLFMSGNKNAQGQFEKYLAQFPKGSFILNAHFYLGESLYNEGRYSEANQHYKFVAGQPTNIFSEPAISKSSELTYNSGRYAEAIELFIRLEEISDDKWNKLKASAGQMNCYFRLEQFMNAINASQKVKKSDKADAALVRDANYIEAKSYYNLGNIDLAIPGFKILSQDTKSEQGAEAKFLLADIYYRQQKTSIAENEVMDYISKGTPYQYWLAKSFLLLSDIYLVKGDEFQAKHTLGSLIQNYSNKTDGILDEAAAKLKAIEAKEQSDDNAAKENSLQMKLIEK